MNISEKCEKCLYEKQADKVKDKQYLEEVRKILKNRNSEDTAPYMIYLFDKLHKEMFGCANSYKEIKKQFNDLVLNKEERIRKKIEQSEDTLLEAFKYARVGNYIDFGAMSCVDVEQFINLLEKSDFTTADMKTYQSFLRQCENAKNFLLICDNCGEIVLDKLFLFQLKQRFPNINIKVMVRGQEVLNDVTEEDAKYVGMDKVAEIVNNGHAVAGTIYEMLPDKAKESIDIADVILAKGQGNYESLNGRGRHIFYSFLCKCDLFVKRFGVEQFTGMFVEEM